MKFQCGKCEKNYIVDNAHTIDKTLTLECTDCDNNFFIQKNFSFSSASGNSKIICENCGQLVNEKSKVCPTCSLVLNKQREAERIDNKVYEKVVVHDGQLYQQHTGGKKGKKILIPALLVSILLSGGGFWFLSTHQHELKNTLLEPVADILPNLSGRTETQVVIMRSGRTYYGKKIEREGGFARITTKNGAVVKVAEKDILEIAIAVMED
jgi:hypothetical protein